MFVNKIKVIIDDKEFHISVLKKWNWRGEIDYYTYHVTIYKYNPKAWFFKYSEEWTWETYWLNYPKYYGNIDKIIKEAIESYKKNISEQKFINQEEIKYI